MNITLLSKEELLIRNKQTLRYTPTIAEKDYFLAVVSKIIYESELSKKIIFKGGTAIHHCYIPQSRFSEDLDFSSGEQHITIEDVQAVLSSQPFLETKDTHVSKATIKIERLKYSGVLDQPNSLKVEIDFIQKTILPAKEMDYKNVWGVETKVRVMDIREICSEKIRAMSDRARYRDFYDYYLINQHFQLKFHEIYDLMNQKEVRKVISIDSIFNNWEVAKQEKEKEKMSIYYQEEIYNNDQRIQELLEGLAFEPISVNSVFHKGDGGE
jgi:predicted nucleotidyltransferase component of viral defense system